MRPVVLGLLLAAPIGGFVAQAILRYRVRRALLARSPEAFHDVSQAFLEGRALKRYLKRARQTAGLDPQLSREIESFLLVHRATVGLSILCLVIIAIAEWRG